MKKLLLFFAVLAAAVSASAENYILYTTSDEGIEKPKNPNAFGVNIVSNTYENGQGKIEFDGEVTVIGENAFNGSKYLTSIVIPNSVTEIGKNAFLRCVNLTSVGQPKAIAKIAEYAFSECSKLAEIDIPNTVTSIGELAFSKCI